MCAATAFGTRVTVFVNASSGWEASEDAPARLEHWFREAGLATDIRFVEKGANLAEMAREAVASGSGIVVGAGGDGTLSATASGFVGTETVFGVLPVGTLNHFARDLHIPLDLEAAAKVVIAGLTDYVDVGEVNGKTFLNNAILGLYPIYRFRRAEHERRGWHGKLALVWAWAQVFARFPTFRVRLHANGTDVLQTTPYMLIANNEHAMEGWLIGARRCLCEGKLWIYVMRHKGRWGLLRMLLRFVMGRFRGTQEFDIFPAEEVWVETRAKRAGIALDGEVAVMHTPLHFRILSRSLRVIVPEGRMPKAE